MYNKYTNNVYGEDWGLLYVDYASVGLQSHSSSQRDYICAGIWCHLRLMEQRLMEGIKRVDGILDSCFLFSPFSSSCLVSLSIITRLRI